MSAATETTTNPRELYLACIAAADQLIEIGEIEKASILLAASARLFPRTGVFHSKLAALAARQHDWANAAGHIESWTKAEPTNVEAWLALSVLSMMIPDVRNAERACRQAIAVAPNDWRGHYQLAMAYNAAKLFDLEEKSLRSAIALAPREWRPYNNLATTLLERGRDREALELLRRAHELAPDEALVLYNLALAYWRSGARSESERCARAAAAIGHDAAYRFLSNFQ